MTYTQNGRIIKMTGGLYTVRLDPAGESPSPLADTVVECRARGQFRHARVSPLVGDRVTVQYDHTSFSVGEDGVARPSGDRSGLMIAEILPRKNSLIRPPLANVDTMLTVVAAASPDPDAALLDCWVRREAAVKRSGEGLHYRKDIDTADTASLTWETKNGTLAIAVCPAEDVAILPVCARDLFKEADL